MIVPGYRVFPLGLIIVVLLAYPVSADEIYPTITHVFFEKDGLPFNGSVHYSVNCYGVNYFGKAEPAAPVNVQNGNLFSVKMIGKVDRLNAGT
jgi:hypothetical protein